MMRKIMDANKKVSHSFERLRLDKLNINEYYKNSVRAHMRAGQTIIDIGGGKKSPIAKFKSEHDNLTLIAVDISDVELESNTNVDQKIIADVTKGIPLPDESVDMVISSSVMEHLQGQDAFIKNAFRILKSNGGSYFIHVFPSKFALFAMLNQLLPHKISEKLVTFNSPHRSESGVFPAHYDKCHYSDIKRLLIENGFRIENIQCSYYQSFYFKACFPVFFISLLWDNLCYVLKIKNLCSYICIIAKK